MPLIVLVKVSIALKVIDGEKLEREVELILN